jgi:hydroxymethylglutaryl-CoA lyase
MLALIEAVRGEVPHLDVGVHLHDTRGSGIANAFAAVQAGVRSLDASVGGLGGCPFAPGASGNIATEELVYLLEECGVSTGIDLDALLRAAAVTERAVDHPLPSSLYRAGGRPRPRPLFSPRRDQGPAEGGGATTASTSPSEVAHGSA